MVNIWDKSKSSHLCTSAGRSAVCGVGAVQEIERVPQGLPGNFMENLSRLIASQRQQFPQHHLDNFSQGWITGQRSQPDGRVRAEVLHRPVGGIPVQQQGLERRVRLPEQALGEEGVRGGEEGNIRDLPAGPGHLEGQPIQTPEQAGDERSPEIYREGEMRGDDQQEVGVVCQGLLRRVGFERGRPDSQGSKLVSLQGKF